MPEYRTGGQENEAKKPIDVHGFGCDDVDDAAVSSVESVEPHPANIEAAMTVVTTMPVSFLNVFFFIILSSLSNFC